jgi:hypothetical protein
MRKHVKRASLFRLARRHFRLCLSAFLFGVSVDATAQDLSNLIGMASLSGDCERLVAAGTNFSDGCNGMIIQSIYSTGRTGFTVTVGDRGVVMTFSGMEGAKPDADSCKASIRSS